MIDTKELARIAEAAAGDDRDNGHCGEGAFERGERVRRASKSAAAFKSTFDPPTVSWMIGRIAELERGLEPFAEAARKAKISGYPPFQFCAADDYEAARLLYPEEPS